MEHLDLIQTALPDFKPEEQKQISLFVKELIRADKKFNLTGLTSPESIISQLVAGSLKPLRNINVPRGTLIADMGAGQGIPGVLLSICRTDLRFYLMESNRKRVDFLKHLRRILSCDFEVIEGRIEELAHDSRYREAYDMVISRAFAPPFVAMECGAALLRKKGLLYIYADGCENDLQKGVLDHAFSLGMSPPGKEERMLYELPSQGYVFIKTGSCGSQFPRRFSVMKRESLKFEKES